ncbi:MAG: M28 family peptidase [Vicingaceae bacterium]|nr:M28 family peptidase [Vicingaceae bacterium]
MKKSINITLSLLLCLLINTSYSQTNIISTNPIAEQIMLGNYSPSSYPASVLINNPDSIVNGINANVSPDSLKSYIFKLASFQNRNTGADTTSSTIGIGAARKWVFSKFQEISAENNNRLVTSYLQFDQQICNVTRHKNIFSVLPGTDTTNNQIIIIEAHLDSRCSAPCDSLCLAEGIEDNASGTALVIELARIMSRYTYKNTIVFMATIGEEQGLFGANAFAQYATNKGIQIDAVFNNDVIGGVICGQTSSAPSCPGLNDIDSLQVRLFSNGGFNSKNKQLSRFIKLEYKEELLSEVAVPMLLTIMSAEDRTGRGGDHIPFRQQGFAAMRFTSANEHGDASNGPGYTDRQHTSDDIIGIDTNNDQIIDSFFIDFNYLARNTVINGVASAMVAIGPLSPDLNVSAINGGGIKVTVTNQTQYQEYRIAVRTVTNDWDSLYTTSSLTDTVYPPFNGVYFVSIASVDSLGIESLFSREILVLPTGVSEFEEKKADYELLQNRPNPFDETTIISVKRNNMELTQRAEIVIMDSQGKIINKLPIELNNEINEVVYYHGYGKIGMYSYSLVVDGKIVSTKQMVFAN